MRKPTSRRRFIAAATGGALVAVAGCLGGDDGPEPEGDTVDELPPPVRGDPDADVTVATYEDFSCPGCRQYKLDIYPLVHEEFIASQRIRYEHHDFPVVNEDWSWQVPSAARAMQDEDGDEAFFEFSSAIYEFQDNYSLDTIADVADEIGSSGDAARTAADEMTYQPVIEASSDAAEERGVGSTPTIAVEDELLTPEEGEDFYESIASAIEAAE